MKTLREIVKAAGLGKMIIWGVLLVVLGVFGWNNLDFITKVTFEVNGQSEPKMDSSGSPGQVSSEKGQSGSGSKEGEGRTYVSIEDIQLAPIATKLPSYFLFTVVFTSNAPDQAVVNVDLGKATLEDVEVVGAFDNVVATGKGTSFLRLKFDGLSDDAPIHIYSLLSAPTFNTIVVDYGGKYTEEATYKGHMNKKGIGDSVTELSFYTILWRIFFVIMVALFVFKIIGLLFDC